MTESMNNLVSGRYLIEKVKCQKKIISKQKLKKKSWENKQKKERRSDVLIYQTLRNHCFGNILHTVYLGQCPALQYHLNVQQWCPKDNTQMMLTKPAFHPALRGVPYNTTAPRSHRQLHDGVDDVPVVVQQGPGGALPGHVGLAHHQLQVLNTQWWVDGPAAPKQGLLVGRALGMDGGGSAWAPLREEGRGATKNLKMCNAKKMEGAEKPFGVQTFRKDSEKRSPFKKIFNSTRPFTFYVPQKATQAKKFSSSWNMFHLPKCHFVISVIQNK